MDTDDLSRESYEGVLMKAGKLTDDLTLRFGVLSGECKNENEYLEKAEKFAREILKANDSAIDDLFWGNPPNKKELEFTCNKILENILKVKSVPVEMRSFDF